MSELEPLFSYAKQRGDSGAGGGADEQEGENLSVAGLFAGIGGIERGLEFAGHHTRFVCEIEERAQRVLSEHFSGVEQVDDIEEMDELPDVDLVTAGFPCKDLSQAGETEGIGGDKSGLVGEVFRLLKSTSTPPRWLLLENVPFMLQLAGGEAMEVLVDWLEQLDYRWAYRIVDTRAFGLPHRRRRVLLLASQSEDPKSVLFSPEGVEKDLPSDGDAFGFYWTEGRTGVGWAISSVPPLKGGSGVGIPSPPAIWLQEEERVIKPDIRDAERLQGFPADWTKPAEEVGRGGIGKRWQMVGNAVSVPVAKWFGERLKEPRPYDDSFDRELTSDDSWPSAAWSDGDERFEAFVTEWPKKERFRRIEDFLEHPGEMLSERATAGFLSRAEEGNLNFEPGFIEALEQHLERMRAAAE